jgi:hypothetical protein
MASTIRPVRAIKAAAYGNPTRVRKALRFIGYATQHVRHTSIDNLIGHLPKADLGLVLHHVTLMRNY